MYTHVCMYVCIPYIIQLGYNIRNLSFDTRLTGLIVEYAFLYVRDEND